MADDVGQVLDQRAAQRHVHDLQAAADAEHRHAPVERGAEERDLGGVPAGPDDRGLRTCAARRTWPGSISGPPEMIRPSRLATAASMPGTGGSSTGAPPAAATLSA